jgi:hypothetical protein
MARVFAESTPNLKGVWSSNKAGVRGAGGNLGVVTNIQIQFSQTVNRIFDLNRKAGKGAFYYIGGRAEGRATFGRLIGPAGSGCDFYAKYGNICNIKDSISITFVGSGKGKCGNTTSTYKMMKPIAVQVGITQNAQDTMINENVQFMFADLDCK